MTDACDHPAVPVVGAGRSRLRWYRAGLIVLAVVFALGTAGVLTDERAQATVFDLPDAGHVRAARLVDGTPVFIVHDHDGAIAVLDAAAPGGHQGAGELVAWCPRAHGPSTFSAPISGRQWDHHGRPLPGWAQEGGWSPRRLRSAAALGRFSIEVAGELVRVGERVGRPPEGASEVDPSIQRRRLVGPPCRESAAHALWELGRFHVRLPSASSDLLTPEEAATGPEGVSTIVAGVLDARGGHMRLCGAARAMSAGCPPDAPAAFAPDGVPIATTRTNGWFRVVRQGDALTDVVALPSPAPDLGALVEVRTAGDDLRVAIATAWQVPDAVRLSQLGLSEGDLLDARWMRWYAPRPERARWYRVTASTDVRYPIVGAVPQVVDGWRRGEVVQQGLRPGEPGMLVRFEAIPGSDELASLELRAVDHR